MTGPLRLPDFRYLFAARAISYVGTYLAPIAVAFAILDNGGGATAVGLGFAAWTLAQVAMLVIGGVVGDRIPRRLVMIGSDVASTAVRTTMGVLLLSGHAEIWQLIALQACGGAAVAFYSPASYGLVREVVPEEQLQQANGLLAIARYAAFPLGAAVGGSIVAFIGSGTALLVDAATYATSALLLSRIHVQSIARAGAGFLQELREGWSAFVEQTWVWVLVVYVSLYFLLTYAPFFVLGPYIAKHSMDGARSWCARLRGRRCRSAARRIHGSPLAARAAADGDHRAAPDGHGGAEPHPGVPSHDAPAHARRRRAPGSPSRSARSSGTRRCNGRSRRRSSHASRRTPGWARWSSCPPVTR